MRENDIILHRLDYFPELFGVSAMGQEFLLEIVHFS